MEPPEAAPTPAVRVHTAPQPVPPQPMAPRPARTAAALPVASPTAPPATTNAAPPATTNAAPPATRNAAPPTTTPGHPSGPDCTPGAPPPAADPMTIPGAPRAVATDEASRAPALFAMVGLLQTLRAPGRVRPGLARSTAFPAEPLPRYPARQESLRMVRSRTLILPALCLVSLVSLAPFPREADAAPPQERTLPSAARAPAPAVNRMLEDADGIP